MDNLQYGYDHTTFIFHKEVFNNTIFRMKQSICFSLKLAFGAISECGIFLNELFIEAQLLYNVVLVSAVE